MNPYFFTLKELRSLRFFSSKMKNFMLSILRYACQKAATQNDNEH